MNAATVVSQSLTLAQAVESIRSLSADSTAAAIAQGRLLRHIEAAELYRERYPSMTAFLTGERLGISAHEARKRMQVAHLTDTEPSLPAGLCLSVLKRLVPLATQNPPALAQISAHDGLPSLTVLEVEHLIASVSECRHVATTDRLFKRMLDDMKRAQDGLSSFAREQVAAMYESALQFVDQAAAILGDDRRHVATTHVHACTPAPMESMVHESMDSKSHESMDSMEGSDGERTVETAAGTVAIPLTGEAVLRALSALGYGKAKEQAAVLMTHGLTVMADQIACLRWELLNGGAQRNGQREAIRNPGALLRRRLTTGFHPPEAFYAAIRGDRKHEAEAKLQPVMVPVEPESPKVKLPPVLQQLLDALRALKSSAKQSPAWVMAVGGLIESGDAQLTHDGCLAVPAGNPVGVNLVRKWADQVTALGIVRGVCFA